MFTRPSLVTSVAHLQTTALMVPSSVSIRLMKCSSKERDVTCRCLHTNMITSTNVHPMKGNILPRCSQLYDRDRSERAKQQEIATHKHPRACPQQSSRSVPVTDLDLVTLLTGARSTTPLQTACAMASGSPWLVIWGLVILLMSTNTANMFYYAKYAGYAFVKIE